MRHPAFLLVLLICFGLVPIGQLEAQTFTTLHSFTALNNSTNNDGANPRGGLILSGSTLYGTASQGGSSNAGSVFAVNADGTSFTTLYSFTGGNDGAFPQGHMMLSGSMLYGTASQGGDWGRGVLFGINKDNMGFTNLHSFTAGGINSDGGIPSGLALSGGTLYGTAQYGGSANDGTVFAVTTDGTSFTTLYSFTGGSDGAFPQGHVMLSGSRMYATAGGGGAWNDGTVFAINSDGTGLTNLYSFTALNDSTNSDGAYPLAGLVMSGNTLYGTAYAGGGSGNGTVFAVNIDGTGFTSLHSFAPTPSGTNSDGAAPHAEMILSGNTLYGTTVNGGISGNGTVFAINIDGTGFTNLHSFTALDNSTNSDGAGPNAGLIFSGNTLYGTTTGGGNSANGTVFSITLSLAPPPLTIVRSGANVILAWPTNLTGVTLQYTTNLLSPMWTTSFPASVVVNGQNTVTDPTSGTPKFYRLSQ